MNQKMNTRKIVYIGLLAEVSTVLMYLEIPLTFLFMPPFLKLDLSGVPTLIGAFMFGPGAGIFITLVKDIIHIMSTQTGGVGELSDFLIYTAFSLVAGGCNAVNPMIDSIDGYILFGAVPFNFIKGVIISAVTFLVYKKLSHAMKDALPVQSDKKPQE